ncbi:M28 family peptidase [Bowmanella denitrificans]
MKHFSSLLLIWLICLPVAANEQLWQHLQILSSDAMEGRKTGSSGAELARDYIKQVFRQNQLQAFAENYEMPFRHEFAIGELVGVNILGWLPGKSKPQQYIVVSAHYDHLGKQGKRIFNGADDNASGVAVMLYLASVLHAQRTEHSVIFLATDAEEAGLYGAQAFVASPPVALSAIKLNLNLDMLGYGGRQQQLYVGGTRHYPHLLSAVERAIAQAPVTLSLGLEGLARGYKGKGWIDYRRASDHAAFDQQGIAFLYLGVGEHRFYHTEYDEIGRIDRRFFTRAAETALVLLRESDQLGIKNTPVGSPD